MARAPVLPAEKQIAEMRRMTGKIFLVTMTASLSFNGQFKSEGW